MGAMSRLRVPSDASLPSSSIFSAACVINAVTAAALVGVGLVAVTEITSSDPSPPPPPLLPPGVRGYPSALPFPPSSPPASSETLGILLGIVLGAVASIGINIGNNIQALGLKSKEEKETDTRDSGGGGEGGVAGNGGGNQRLFVIGTVIFVSSSLVNFGAFALAPASILAPLESFQFVSNLLFNHYVNHAPISWRMINGVVLVIVGCGTAVGLGPSSVFKFTLQDLVDYWTSPAWIAYLWCIIVLALLAEATNYYYHKEKRRGRDPPYSKTVLPVTFAVSSALIGTQSVVQAKCLSECVEQLGKGVNVFGHAYFWIALFLFVSLVAVWLFRLTKALEYFDPLFIIPLLQSNYILFATISGGIYFKEFEALEGYQWFGFASGIAIMFTGLYMLAPLDEVQETLPSAISDSCRAENAAGASNSSHGRTAAFSSRAKTMPTAGKNHPPPPPSTAGDIVTLSELQLPTEPMDPLEADSRSLELDGSPLPPPKSRPVPIEAMAKSPTPRSKGSPGSRGPPGPGLRNDLRRI